MSFLLELKVSEITFSDSLSKTSFSLELLIPLTVRFYSIRKHPLSENVFGSLGSAISVVFSGVRP